VFTSDNIADYDTSTMELYLSMFPLKQKQIRRVKNQNELYTIDFYIEENDYLVYANLSGKKRRVLPGEGEFVQGRNFREPALPVHGGREIELAPFESKCLLRVEGKQNGGTKPDRLFPEC